MGGRDGKIISNSLIVPSTHCQSSSFIKPSLFRASASVQPSGGQQLARLACAADQSGGFASQRLVIGHRMQPLFDRLSVSSSFLYTALARPWPLQRALSFARRANQLAICCQVFYPFRHRFLAGQVRLLN